jgi:hypothetical protein
MAYFSRGPNIIQNVYTFPDMYEDYISDKEESSPYYVTYNEYVTLCSEYYKQIAKALIDDGIKFKLPFGLGEFYVLKKKSRINSKKPIDWKTTLECGKRIYNLNDHTSGYGYTFFWTKPNNIKNKFMYRFVFTRTNKRYLAKVIKEKKQDYFER